MVRSAMGDSGYGQLGGGAIVDQSSPIQILNSGVTQIAAGYHHSLFIKEDGSLWGMGYNGTYQLGLDNADWPNTPQKIVDSGVTLIAAGYYHSLFLKEDGSLWGMGYNQYGQLGNNYGYSY